MASISTSIQVVDKVSAPMMTIISSIDNTISAFEDLGNSIDSNMDASSINTARQQLSAAVEQLGQVDEGIENNINKQEAFTGTVRESTGAFSSLGKTIMGLAIVQSAIGAVRGQMSSAFQRMDTLENFPKVMSNLGINADDATASINTMSDKLKGLPTPLQDAATSVQRFTSANNDIQKSTNMFLAVNNAILAGGADMGTQQSALEQLSQAYAKGRPDMMEWRAAMTAMPAQMNQVAEAMGYVNADALGESLRNGTVSMDSFMNTLIELNETGINGFPSLEEQARNATGGFITSIENMKSAVTRGITSIIDRVNQGLTKAGFGTIQEQIVSFGQGAETMLGNIGTIAGNVIMVISPVMDIVVAIASFIIDNWSIISPIIYGIIAALGLYNATLVAGAIIHGIVSAATAVHAGVTAEWSLVTFLATAQQKGLNAALMACPLTWIIGLVILLIVVVFMVANAIAKTTKVANTGFGVIAGGISVVIACFWNLLLVVANVAMGIWSAIKAVASNMVAAFSNAINGIKSWFYDLLSTAVSVVDGICAALNKLPFVKFDYSGITAQADAYAAKSAAAAGAKQEYKSISAEFSKGFKTFDAFKSGWASKAFSAGAAWGDKKIGGLPKMPKISSKALSANAASMLNNKAYSPSGFPGGGSGYSGGGGGGYSGGRVPKHIADTAGNTARTADSLSITNENLKYLRDLAERKAINRFTTAEIKVEMNNTNNIKEKMDLDGVVDYLASGVQNAMEKAAEGVHS